MTKVLKVLTQEGWGKEGYQTPGRSRLKQAAVAIGSREIEEGRHGKLELREAPWDDQSPTAELANYCHKCWRTFMHDINVRAFFTQFSLTT